MTDRYDFGRNWSEFAEKLTPAAISQAETALTRLIKSPANNTFLDIGCGSGLHSLAALRLGVARVVAFDYDEDSVETTRRVLTEFNDRAEWEVTQGDILAPSNSITGLFDIVYSWGVLHHTGAMWQAI